VVKVKRLTNKKIIKKLLSTGSVYKTRKYKIYFSKNLDDFSYAISISKKVGKAYCRNKEKRWVRSIIYQNRSLFEKGGNAFIIIKESGGIFIDASSEIVSFINQNYK